MNKVIINLFSMFGFAMLFFSSCKKGDTAEPSISKLYLLNNLDYPLVNEYSFSIISRVREDGVVVGRTVSSGDSVFSFPVKINVPVKEAVTAKVELDTTYTPEKIRGIDSLLTLISQKNFELKRGSVTIPAGAYQSSDSIVVALKDFPSLLAGKKSGEKGILPLKITTQSSGVAPSSNLSTLKIMGLYKFDTTNIDLSNTAIPATLLNRTGWKVAAYGSQSYGKAVNALDGDYATSWMSDASSAWIAIDMGSVNTLRGIQLSPNYKYGVEYNITTFDIFTSNDSVTWQLQGKYTGSKFGGSVSAPDIRNVHFYTPVQARYFKISYIDIDTSDYAGASEIKVF